MRAAAVLILAFGALAAPGCGGDDSGDGGPAESGTRTGQVTMSELEFTPGRILVEEGSMLAVRNDGSEGHDLKLREDGDEIGGTEILNPGETQQLAVMFPKGKYEMYCSVPGHETGGMSGTFVY